MRTLCIHSRGFRFEARQKASEGAEPLPESGGAATIDGECIVLFIAAETGDEGGIDSLAEQVAADTLKRAEQVGVRTVVVYPYVHLTETPSTPRTARSLLEAMQSRLAASLTVVRAPFGWYKAFGLSCLGHPLSEWSGRYHPGEAPAAAREETAGRRPSEFVRFVLADADGSSFDVEPDNFEQCPMFSRKEPVYALLRQFVANELGGGVPTEGIPKHIEYMQRHKLVDYCEVSEKGHHKWYPKGLLMQKLLLDYASNLAREWGAFEMRNPMVIRGDHNIVGKLMGEFHERDYVVDGGRGICYLRYASDPCAFPFMQQVRFNRRQSPLKVYEEASCFRNEQQGEVSGLKRVRNFLMTDMHAACATTEQAWDEFERLCERFAALMNDIIAPGRWVLGWEGTVGFYEENRERLLVIGRGLGVPAFFKLMPQMSHYYAIKNEYQAITEDKANVQVSTVQWDVKDGERFDIGFTDEDGRKHPCPVIIHASSFGSIERTLCAILEKIAIDASQGMRPMFPLWLAPTQVRVVPVSQEHAAAAFEFCRRVGAGNVRADVDDRDGTVGRKIRDAEKEWVPYVAVVGEREEQTGRLAVRIRKDNSRREMTPEELIAAIREQTGSLPFRPLPLPVELSRRSIFQ